MALAMFLQLTPHNHLFDHHAPTCTRDMMVARPWLDP
jgi:hypothetical protein